MSKNRATTRCWESRDPNGCTIIFWSARAFVENTYIARYLIGVLTRYSWQVALVQFRLRSFDLEKTVNLLNMSNNRLEAIA